MKGANYLQVRKFLLKKEYRGFSALIIGKEKDIAVFA
jgi:hypothetical protein